MAAPQAGEARWREPSPPSAPPLPAAAADEGPGGSAGASSSGSGGSPPAAAAYSAGLYQDLLRRANGDHQLAALWLAEMGLHPRSAPLSQEQATIKAVGTAPGALAAAWSSLSGAAGSPSKAHLLHSAPAAMPPRGDADLDGQAAEAGAPRIFFCPISMQIMRDPVCLPTGQTYDRPCIARWLLQGNSSCPATGQALPPPVVLVPNVALRGAIEEWAEKHAPWLLDGNHKVKPVPKEEQFAALPSPSSVRDPDLAYAIRLQQEELQRIASGRQQRGQGAGGAAAGGVAAAAGGVAAAGAATAARSGSMGAAPGAAPAQLPPQQAAAAAAARPCWASPTSWLLAGVTAAYLTLFILSLADNGWNIEDLSLNPWAGASQSALLSVGAQEAQLVTTGGQWWRLFSSPFVNAGIIQLLFSMTCLWTFGRYLEGAFRGMHPAPCIAAIYLIGAWVGALASANLNAYYVTCGGLAGVCALLGAMWADQLANHRKYKSKAWTLLVLTLVTAVYIVASLLPLVDPWYQAAALLSGFLCGMVLLLLPRVGRGRPASKRFIAVQCLCGLAVAGAVGAAVAGIVLNAGVGSKAQFLEDGSCVGFSFFQCIPSNASPNGCAVEASSNGTRLLLCPSGASQALPSGISLSSGDAETITQLCLQYCAAELGSGVDDAAGGGGGGGGTGSPPGGDDWSSRPPPVPKAGAVPVPAGGGGAVLLSTGALD